MRPNRFYYNKKSLRFKEILWYYITMNFKRLKICFSIFLFIFIVIFLILFLKTWFITQKILVKNSNASAPGLLYLKDLQPENLEREGDGRINILLLGIPGGNWEGPELTDTIMVASLDPISSEVSLLSIPRDLWVPLGNGNWNKINAIYSIGGSELIKKTVSKILDTPIHYFVLIDFDGFKQVIDLLGGVKIKVEEDIYDPFFPDGKGGYELFYLQKGTYLMDGEIALKYVRSRHTSSDFSRAKRQQQLLLACKDRLLKLRNLLNPKKLVNILSILGDHLKTDLTLSEMIQLFELGKEIDITDIQSYVIDSSNFLYDDMIEGMYILRPRDGNFKLLQRFAHHFFQDSFIKNENALIALENGTNIVDLARIKADLESFGYNIIRVSNAEKLYPKTIIYDFTNGTKPFTLHYLKKRFNAEIRKGTEELNSFVDILIILGSDIKL